MQNTRSSTALALSGAAPASLPTPGTKDRLVSLEAAAPGTRHAAEELIALAVAGLPQSYVGGTFAQTVRAVETPTGRIVRPEGRNLRYAAIVALGAARVDEGAQRAICAGRTAAAFAESLVPQAESSDDVGSVALVAWAVAEVAEAASESLFERLRNVFASGAPISTVECSWLITAALAARHLSDTDDLAQAAAARLMAAQGPGGLFPHMLPAHAMGRLRAHVGCFADQVYPIQALARFSVAMGEPAALAAADAVRRAHLPICRARRAMVVALRLPATATSSKATRSTACTSTRWRRWRCSTCRRPAAAITARRSPRACAGSRRGRRSDGDLVSHADRLVWRKVGRSEPRKAVRAIAAVTTALRPGLHLPGLDALFAPGPIDHECRPYELGWLIYAWLSGGVVERLRDGGVRRRPPSPSRRGPR